MAIKTLHIGLDDTDSPRAGCTTYIAALLVEKLRKLGVQFIDYPNLIRLNPNVPWKTRGNGALCLRIKCEENSLEEIKENVIETVEEKSDLEHEGTDPGIVFFQGSRIPKEIRKFARETITGIVKIGDALKLLKKFKAEAIGYKTARGIIGSLAAIGETLRGDHTFEFIAYRKSENYGKKRQVDPKSVIEMDRATAPYTFNNFDEETNRILITPRGPDPVLFGIRGEGPEIVKKAAEMIRVFEPVERWVIFRTNHGTDAHLKHVQRLSEIEPYHPVIVRGEVAENPKIIPGSHVIFKIKDGSGVVDCAAYEPTGTLRDAAVQLIKGDYVEVYGGVKPPSLPLNRPITINLEKLKVLRLAPLIVYQNPLCPKCRKRLKSMGKDKGFRCEKCGSRFLNLKKVALKLERKLSEGLYIASPRSQRHLTKPLIRYGMEKKASLITIIPQWSFP